MSMLRTVETATARPAIPADALPHRHGARALTATVTAGDVGVHPRASVAKTVRAMSVSVRTAVTPLLSRVAPLGRITKFHRCLRRTGSLTCPQTSS